MSTKEKYFRTPIYLKLAIKKPAKIVLGIFFWDTHQEINNGSLLTACFNSRNWIDSWTFSPCTSSSNQSNNHCWNGYCRMQNAAKHL
ncbi:hypothetical protein PGTUg99_008959 [Puccinia graminis f. sp. tritici]|uniref:Uncharacterized protein n=1 Tax=Puccinia graminis f. sp. tritici TaxID=56615 RepID=A0A5B0NFK0_PUCGR|nr:hypothetical protein PGTUg99_008959 [Puccinia graminis f. sp. tritici]